MKVFISFDMEGVAGIVDWEQCIGSGPRATRSGAGLSLGEVNAAIDGAIEARRDRGPRQRLALDMQNLPPAQLHGGCDYLSGRHKPLYMMEGLDAILRRGSVRRLPRLDGAPRRPFPHLQPDRDRRGPAEAGTSQASRRSTRSSLATTACRSR